MLVSFLSFIPILALSAFAVPASLSKRYSGVLIYSGRRPNLCLSTTFIRGPRPGVDVNLVDCAIALTWDINPGAGYVTVHDNALVLDADYLPGNGGPLGMNTPVPGKNTQNWYYTDDLRIAITGGNQCLDDSGTGLQTWQCTTGNTNQIFYTRAPVGGGGGSGGGDGGGGGSNPVQPPDIPYGTIYQDPAQGDRLHALSRSDLCMTVLGGEARAGANVAITYCVSNEDGRVGLQLWDFSQTYAKTGLRIYLARDRQFCLSSTDGNGAGVTLQRCEQARDWTFNNQFQRFFLSFTNFCLDVRAESRAGNESPLNSVRTLQAWQCYENNPNQNFYTLP